MEKYNVVKDIYCHFFSKPLMKLGAYKLLCMMIIFANGVRVNVCFYLIHYHDFKYLKMRFNVDVCRASFLHGLSYSGHHVEKKLLFQLVFSKYTKY